MFPTPKTESPRPDRLAKVPRPGQLETNMSSRSLSVNTFSHDPSVFDDSLNDRGNPAAVPVHVSTEPFGLQWIGDGYRVLQRRDGNVRQLAFVKAGHVRSRDEAREFAIRIADDADSY